jgi:hypothetical protein
MRYAFLLSLALGAALPGCGAEQISTDNAVATLDASARAAEAGAPIDAAQRETESAACDPMQCERRAAELASSLAAPAEVALSVKGGECARVEIAGVTAGMACTCLSSNGWLFLGPEGTGCFARGRAGTCLWDDSELNGPCTIGDPACTAQCDELHKRYAADAAKSFNVEVRFSTCEDDDACHHVLRIEDTCYADYSFESGRGFDCKLSDAEILVRAR